MREKQTQLAYEKYLKSKPDVVSDWQKIPSPIVSKHWKLIKNKFPYDALDIARHDLIIPKRPFQKLKDATEEEVKDLIDFLDILDSQYSYIRQNNTAKKTVPAYFHIHCIRETEHFVELDFIGKSEETSFEAWIYYFKNLFHGATGYPHENIEKE